LKLEIDEQLSNFAFSFKLRRYTLAGAGIASVVYEMFFKVGDTSN
jgi:hypothetical protein